MTAMAIDNASVWRFARQNRAILDAVYGLLESAREPQDAMNSVLPPQRLNLVGGDDQIAILKELAEENGLHCRSQARHGEPGVQVTLEVPNHRLQLIVICLP